MKNVEQGLFTVEKMASLPEGSEERRTEALRILSQSRNMAALCAVAFDYLNGCLAGEGGCGRDVAESVAMAARRMAYKAYSDSTLALDELS